MATITERVQRLREEKAISHKPELEYRVHMYSSEAEGTGNEEDYNSYAKVYTIHSWSRKAVSIIADSIAPLPTRVVEASSEEEIQGHELTELFEYVNDEMGPADLWQEWVVQMMIAGEAFFEFVPSTRGRLAEVWPRPPDKMKVVPDDSPDRLYYPRPAGYLYGDDDVLLPADVVKHDKFYNPLNPWRGLAPIRAVREAIIIDVFAQAWSKSFLQEGARPDYALLTPQGLTESERDELETKLARKHSGPDKWHRPIILESGITDLKTFSFSPKDIEWMAQRELARDEVAAIFGVPDELMGYGKDTYQNFRTAYRVFWQLTLSNIIGFRDRALTQFFKKQRKMLKPNERFKTDVSSVGALQEEIGPKVTIARDLWSMGVPYNNIEGLLKLGTGPILGGEIGFIPYSLIPQGGEHRLPVGIQGRPSEGLGGEEEQTPGYDPDDYTGGGDVSPGYSRELEPITKSPEIDEAKRKALDAKLTMHEAQAQRALKREFQEQQNDILRVLRSWDYTGAEIEEIKAGWPNWKDLLDWGAAKERVRSTFDRLIGGAAEDFGSDMLSSLGIDTEFHIGNMTDKIKNMTITLANDITKTTQIRIQGEIQDILIEAMENSWGVDEVKQQIHDRVSEVFNIRKGDYETYRIAHDQMHRAANMSRLEAMGQARVELKRWISMMDPPKARLGHMDTHRATIEGIPINEPFVVNGNLMMYPGDGPPEEVVNCRCFADAVIIK